MAAFEDKTETEEFCKAVEESENIECNVDIIPVNPDPEDWEQFID